MSQECRLNSQGRPAGSAPQCWQLERCAHARPPRPGRLWKRARVQGCPAAPAPAGAAPGVRCCLMLPSALPSGPRAPAPSTCSLSGCSHVKQVHAQVQLHVHFAAGEGRCRCPGYAGSCHAGLPLNILHVQHVDDKVIGQCAEGPQAAEQAPNQGRGPEHACKKLANTGSGQHLLQLLRVCLSSL